MKYYITLNGDRVARYSNRPMTKGDDLQYEVETDIEFDKIGRCDYTNDGLVYNENYILLDKQDAVRKRRINECFPIINRGILWYETLTDEQKQELRNWYLAWLDAPATFVIPDKPNWIRYIDND